MIPIVLAGALFTSSLLVFRSWVRHSREPSANMSVALFQAGVVMTV